MNAAIWWIRRDLRIRDNQALLAALDEFDEIIPLFIVDPKLVSSEYTAECRLAFLWEGLRELDEELRKVGSKLIIRQGDPLEILSQLIADIPAQMIFAEADYSPYARNRDRKIAAELPLRLAGSTTLRHPEEVLKPDGSPYVVYTPYMNSWKDFGMPTPESIPIAPKVIHRVRGIEAGTLPVSSRLRKGTGFESGSRNALARLKDFTEGVNPSIYSYGDLRNRVDLDATSQLSPYLRFGMISVREAFIQGLAAGSAASTEGARKGVEVWLNELIWREFYVSILYHYPYVMEQSFRPEYRNISWSNDEAAYQAWCEGRTGFPIVDAAMRQLLNSGWMHNRARMITASFLVKDLLIDWRWGEKWFMQHLVDGDPAANNGGWQWAAGTGTDAAPYFRIFNPILQSKKYDPKGEYIHKWVPELTDVPGEVVHSPWQLSTDEQKEYGCQIGKDYPHPIIDHKWARERALEVYKRAREQSSK